MGAFKMKSLAWTGNTAVAILLGFLCGVVCVMTNQDAGVLLGIFKSFMTLAFISLCIAVTMLPSLMQTVRLQLWTLAVTSLTMSGVVLLRLSFITAVL